MEALKSIGIAIGLIIIVPLAFFAMAAVFIGIIIALDWVGIPAQLSIFLILATLASMAVYADRNW
jgi:hypothetical protein